MTYSIVKKIKRTHINEASRFNFHHHLLFFTFVNSLSFSWISNIFESSSKLKLSLSPFGSFIIVKNLSRLLASRSFILQTKFNFCYLSSYLGIFSFVSCFDFGLSGSCSLSFIFSFGSLVFLFSISVLSWLTYYFEVEYSREWILIFFMDEILGFYFSVKLSIGLESWIDLAYYFLSISFFFFFSLFDFNLIRIYG